MEEIHDKEWAKAYLKKFCNRHDVDGETFTTFPSTYYWTVKLLAVVSGKVYRLEEENKKLKERLEKLEKKIEKEEHKRFFRGLGQAFGGD